MGTGTSNSNFDQFFADNAPSAADKKRQVQDLLRQYGIDIPLTQGDIYDQLYDLFNTDKQTSDSAEQKFADAISSGIEQPKLGEQINAAVNQQRQTNGYGDIAGLIEKLLGSIRASGPKPSVIQGINDSQAFDAYNSDALGPAPSQEYQNAFAENFKPEGSMQTIFDKYVQGQEPYLQNQFLAKAYQDFSAPGVMDNIKNDYLNLQREGDNARMNGTGGSLPSFEDYVKQRVSDHYQDFLTTQKSQLRKAFELASPSERGITSGSSAGNLAPQTRIL